jgi:transposase-like protein
MPKYSQELKEKIIKDMLPPNNIAVKDLSEKHGICDQTLYKWKRVAKANGSVVQNSKNSKEKYSNEAKLNIIIETASLNEEELSEYCRKKGLYVDEIKSWKTMFITGKTESETKANEELKSKDAELKRVQKELDRKEKALAEAAALLVLRKKMNAIWNSGEDD